MASLPSMEQRIPTEYSATGTTGFAQFAAVSARMVRKALGDNHNPVTLACLASRVLARLLADHFTLDYDTDHMRRVFERVTVI